MAGHAGIVHDSRVYRPSDTSWHPEGKCREEDETLFYHPENERDPARSQRVEAAKAICRTCPVMAQCLDDARARREPYGTWGGESEDDRRKWLRRQDRARLKAEQEAAEKEAAEKAEPQPEPGEPKKKTPRVADGTPCARCEKTMRTRREGRRTYADLDEGEEFHRARGLCDHCYRRVGKRRDRYPTAGLVEVAA